MKNQITFFIILSIMMLQISYGQANKSIIENMNLILSTNPLLIYQDNMPNVQIGVNWKWVEINVSGAYSANVGKVEGFETQNQKYSISPALKFYPFNSFFNCLYHSIGKGKDIAPCYTFKKKNLPTRPNGIYLKAGYVFEQMKYNYIADADLNSPISEFPFGLKNNGVQVEGGFQLTIRWLSIGVGYGGFLSFPEKAGSIDPFGDTIYTGTYPFKYRFEHQVVLQTGINLNFKK